MGASLFEQFPELVAEADEILGFSLARLCAEDPEELLGHTQYTQPALFVVNALSQLADRRDGGPEPDFAAGHSLGEYNALHAAGAFDFATGLRLVRRRGALMATVTGGGMAAVAGLGRSRVAELLAEHGLSELDIANDNNPAQVVLAGPADALERAREVFERAGAGLYTVLRVSGPFHSRYMAAIADDFAAELAAADLSPPRFPVIANVTAEPYGADIAELLVRQLTSPVRWTDSVRYLLSRGVADIDQLGPGRVVAGLVRAIRRDAEKDAEKAAPREAGAAPKRRRASRPRIGSVAERLRADVVTVVAEVLGVEAGRVSPDSDLSDLGFDSVKLIRFADRLREDLGVDLSPSVFFEFVSLDAFLRHLLADHAAVLEKRYADAPPAPPAPVRREPAPAPTPRPAASAASADSGIAVVGIAAVLPGSASVDEFWQRLLDGDELVGSVPAGRWDDWTEPGPGSRRGAFVSGVDDFDCGFFGISPAEAELMDPHQRLFLQVAWQAIEDSGRDPGTLAGSRTGVFVGHGSMDYLEVLSHSSGGARPYTATGLAHSILPNRLSHLLDLRGPSEAVDTACSSSLVALHRAVRSLRDAECDTAVVGGASLLMSPTPYVSFEKAGMLSPDGRCRTFDRAANGYVRGEGVLAVVLKPLDRAQADGDHVYAVIRGTAVNHGGRSASLTAPNPEAQADLIATAWQRAGLDPATVGYIEAHGTGTTLGDPIEVEGLRKAFARMYQEWGHDAPTSAHCRISSVKTAIGHLEAAAGLAGLVAAVLAMRHGRLPGLRHFTELNPFIRLDGSPLRITGEPEDWPRMRDESDAELPRRCGVSSFGFGGTNAHVVLEEAPAPLPAQETGGAQIVTLSARTPQALRAYAISMIAWLDRNAPAGAPAGAGLPELAATLQTGRGAMDERLAVVAGDLDDLHDTLLAFAEGQAGRWHAGNAAGARGLTRLFAEGAEHRALMDVLAAAGDPDRVALLWAAGADIDWDRLYPERGTRRVPAPAYPFEPRRIRPTDLTRLVPAGRAVAAALPAAPSALPSRPAGGGVAEVREHLIDTVADTLRWRRDEVDPAAGFEELGLNSLVLEQLRRRLEEQYGPVPATTLFVHKNLGSLAEHLAERAVAAPAPAPVAPSPAAPAGAQDIAIVGIGGRYPMAANTAEFWDNLRAGRDCVTEIPAGRPGYDRYEEMARERFGADWPRWGGFLDGVDEFDPQLFNISPREARFLDPQERLFLQTAWETLEDAGYTRAGLGDDQAGDRRGPVGVFAGVTWNNYQMFAGGDLERGTWRPVTSQTFSVANRVSYLFNLGGPSVAVDTACSSSLYAIHLACAAIRRGECTAALAGGVNLSLHPSKYVMLAEAGFLASDGRCHAFGDGGTGYVPAEAVGAVLLKPLDRAVADGDHIYAVIKGSAVNSDGRTYGYSVPNPVAQTELIHAAARDSGVEPSTLSYVEAHGTGTALGDPIEVRGLTDAHDRYTAERGYCAIGSVKANIGHAEAAAGIAQITKVALQLSHGELVPSLLHADRENPRLDLPATPFHVQRDLAPWERRNSQPRRAGISSFGAGGVNVHVVLEEAPPQASPARDDRPQILTLSARDPERLRAYAARMAEHLGGRGAGLHLADVAYTLATGREMLECTVSFRAATVAEAAQRFAAVAAQGLAAPGVTAGNAEGAAPAGRRVSLPTYPFARERYWLDEPEQRTEPALPPAATDLPALLAATPESERLDVLAGRLQTELGRLLEFPADAPPDRRRGFFDLGLDSVLAVRLGNLLEEALGVDLYASVTFDYPCIDDLTGYLLDHLDLQAPEPAAPAPAAPDPTVETVRYAADWEPGPAGGASAAIAGPVVVFAEDGELTDLAAGLPGVRVITVRPGIGPAGDGDTWWIRPEEPDDYAALLDGLGGVPRVVVHAWSGAEAGFRSAFLLSQELLRRRPADPVRLLRLQTYAGAAPEPAAEAFGGFARAVGHESPRLRYQVVTVHAGVDPVRACLAELRLADAEPEVRQDEDGRWVRRLRELTTVPDEPAVRIRDGGVYLITGGAGGLGLVFAEHLARRAAGVRLLLAGRSPLEADRVAACDRIRQLGADVRYEQADVADPDDVARLVGAARDAWGGITGIVHSAGVLRDGLLLSKTLAETGDVLAGKIDGARHLDAATRGDDLDFFMVFSSLAGLAGNPGQSDYAYASRFLTAFARERERLRRDGARSGVSIAVAWPFWRDGGMRVDEETQGFVSRRLGLEQIETATGLETFDAALRLGVPEVGVVRADRTRLDRVLRIEPPVAGAGPSLDAVERELRDMLEQLGC